MPNPLYVCVAIIAGAGGGDADPLEELLALPFEGDEPGPSAEAEPSLWMVEARALLLTTYERSIPQTLLLPGEFTVAGETFATWDVAGLYRPGVEQLYPSFIAGASVEMPLNNNFWARADVTSGELRSGDTLVAGPDGLASFGTSPGDAFAQGYWLNELTLSWGDFGATVDVGRRFLTLADGLVYTDVATGAFASAQLDALPLRLSFAAVAPGRDWRRLEKPSPLLSAEATVEFAPFQTVSFFVAALFDRERLLEETLRGAFAATVIERVDGELSEQIGLDRALAVPFATSGHLTYFGASTELSLADFRFLATAVVLDGNSDVEERFQGGILDEGFELSGWAATSTLSYVSERSALSIWGAFMSGDRVENGSYGAFIGAAPFWGYSPIFFISGVSQTLTGARVSSGGVNGHGVRALGPRFEYVGDEFSVQARVLSLWADVDPVAELSRGGRHYGFESDLETRFALTSNLALRAIAAAFVPGDYFPQSDFALRTVLMLEGSIGS